MSSQDARKALIEEGRRRMEEFRRRSISPTIRKGKEALSGAGEREEDTAVIQSPVVERKKLAEGKEDGIAAEKSRLVARLNGAGQHLEAPYTPVARGFKNQLDKLKKDELDLAAAEWGEQLNRIATIRKEYEEEIEELQRKLSEETEAKTKLEADVEMLNKSKVELEGTIKSERGKLFEANSQLSTYQDECTNLRAKVHSLASEIEERARNAVNRLAESHSERDADLAVLQKQLELQVATIDRVEGDNEILSARIVSSSKLVEELQHRLEEANADAKVKLNALESALQDAKKELDGKDEERRNALAAAEKKFDKERVQLQEHLSKVQAANIENREELEGLNLRLSNMEARCTELKLDNMDTKENLAITLEENRKLKNSLEVEKGRGDDGRKQYATRLEDSEEELKALRSTSSELQKSLEAAKEVVKFEKSRSDAVKEKLAKVEEELEKSIQTNHKFQSSAMLLREDLNAKVENIEFLEKKLLMKTKALESSHAEMAKARLQFEEKESELAKAEERISELKSRLKESGSAVHQEEEYRKKMEEGVRKLQEQHIKELRAQADQFHSILLEERQAVDSEVRRSPVDGQNASEVDTVLLAFRHRIEALESSNKILTNWFEAKSTEHPTDDEYELTKPHASPNRQREKLLLKEQARTIHQLTLEVEQQAKERYLSVRDKLERNGLAEKQLVDTCEELRLDNQSLDLTTTSREGHESENTEVCVNRLEQHTRLSKHDLGDSRIVEPKEDSMLLESKMQFLETQLALFRKALENESDRRRDAEEKTSYLQSKFTTYFLEQLEADGIGERLLLLQEANAQKRTRKHSKQGKTTSRSKTLQNDTAPIKRKSIRGNSRRRSRSRGREVRRNF